MLRLALSLLLPALIATACSSSQPAPQPAVDRTEATPPGFRVAFLGDQGLGPNPRAVLTLVHDEGAQMLLELGDFDYADDPNAWDAQIDDVLGPAFPVFAVVGNHDLKRWDVYRQRLKQRLARVPGARCDGEYGVNAACSYRGLFFVLSGAGTRGSDHAAYLRDQLAQSSSIWRVCAWHKNQRALQLGSKDDATGWDVYEACRTGSAIVANAHEHSYERTKTLRDFKSRRVDPQWRTPDRLRVGGGSTFAFVAGLGGESIRNQARCHPTTPPYGCNLEWAHVYTSDQDATYGALFIDFNVDGDPHRARGYFKNIRGETVDRFEIVAQD